MDLRNRLREETKESHQQLDSEVGKLGVFDSRAGYVVYLSSLHTLYSVYADQIDWASEQAGLTRCTKSLQTAIQSDCRGVDPDWKPSTEEYVASESMTPSSCWGSAYVLEGSAMGARYMVKHAQSSTLIADGEIQLSYLNQLAEESYERWPVFVAALETVQCDADAIVLASQTVFQTAANIFSRAIQRHHQTALES